MPVQTRQFAFHANVKPNPPDLLQGKTPEQFVKELFLFKGYSSYQDSLMHEGVIRLGGWMFGFGDYLREYIIQRYGSLERVYAPNRTAVRTVLRGRVTILAETDRSKQKASER